jgi:hypothetical protein
MAIQGLIGTGAFSPPGTVGFPDSIPAFERPTNWRMGVLMRFPNGHAPLVALTALMKKKVTDDAQFHWWERELATRRLTLSGNITNVANTIGITVGTFGGAEQAKTGDILRTEHEAGGAYELMQVTSVAAPNLNVTRGFAGTTALAVNVGANNPNLMIVGSAYEEGVSTPASVRYRPVKNFNYTQIFRDSLQATRTAMQTRLRTVDEVRDAKTQALLYHTMGMEYGFIFGQKFEGVGAGGQPQRMTGGMVQFINGAGMVTDFTGVDVGWALLEQNLMEVFRFGSQEKLALMGNRAMMTVQRIARVNSNLFITPTIKEYGMDVRRLFTPFGTLVMKTHPLFNQINSAGLPGGAVWGMDTWALILDMANITYRPLRNSDTQYLPDRQANGVDGLTSEYLTEAGLEVDHSKTHALWKGLRSAKADVPPLVTP